MASFFTGLLTNPAVQQTLQSVAEQGISALGQLAEQGLQGLLGMMTGGGGGQQGVLDAPCSHQGLGSTYQSLISSFIAILALVPA